MEPGSSDRLGWPTTRWELPAPDSYVLLNGVQRLDSQPFKLALMELVGRRALALVALQEAGRFGRRRQRSVLTEGAHPQLPAERSLAAVWRLFTGTPLTRFGESTLGVKVEDFAQAAERRYRPLPRYTVQEVLPALVEQGYFARENRRLLGIFPSRRYVLTARGESARAELQGRVDLGEASLYGWLKEEPERALRYMTMAGGSLLLLPMLFNALDEMAHRRRDPLPTPVWSADRSDGVDDHDGLDARSWTGLADLTGEPFDFTSLDIDAFSGVETTFTAIEAGVDTTAGGGGGWGNDPGSWGGDGGSGSDNSGGGDSGGGGD